MASSAAHDLLWTLLLLPAGFVAGVINVLAGGGSFLTLPVLIAAGLPVHVANGTNRLSVIAQGLFATVNYNQKGEFDSPLFRRLLPALVLGSLFGAWLATLINPKDLQKAFGALFLAMGVVLSFRHRLRLEEPGSSHPLRFVALFLVGLYGGFIQAGVGLWILITTSSLFRVPALRANSVKLALTLTFTVPAFLIFLLAGMVRWVPAVVLAAGTVLGTWVGVRLSLQGGAQLIWRAVTVVLFATGLHLLIQ